MARNNTWKRTIKGTLIGSVCAFALAGAAIAQTVNFDVPAGDLKTALDTYIRQSGVQLIYRVDDVRGKTTKGVHGALSSDDALSELLAGSGVIEKHDSSGALVIVKEREPDAASIRAPIGGMSDPTEYVTEVTVTGTHIRGGRPTSPLHTVTRPDIERSGFSQIGDIIRSLPENFAGGQNPGVINGSDINAANVSPSGASSVNLRGLGSDATLVLVNGHRLSADSFFQGPDISGVPLSAIQRIEIVPDGASALYGSDAVAGVVNFIMRRNYSGAELSADIGSTTAGGGGMQNYSFLAGAAHSSWYALGNVEYAKQEVLRWGDRAFTAGVTPENMLLAPQKRVSAFFSAGGDLNNRLRFTVDGLLSQRRMDRAVDSGFYVAYTDMNTRAYNFSPSLEVQLTTTWRAHLTGVASGSDNVGSSSIPAYSYYRDTHTKNRVEYAEATADGALLKLPSGDIKVAIGAGYRTERYQSGVIKASRNVKYLFVEALAPLVTPSALRAGFHEFDLSIAGRIEQYSDFGRTANPKIGFRYVPLNGLTIRGSWGKSLKAPSFDQMYSSSDAYLYYASALGGTHGGTALLLFGGNPHLKPEESTSWTLGADFRPATIKSMTLSATYFDIDYTNRVVQPVNNFNVGLENPIYSTFVEVVPPIERVEAVIAESGGFYSYTDGPLDPSSVVGIVNDRLQNATAQSVRGVDVSYRQSIHLETSDIDLFANASTLRLKQTTIASAAPFKLSGTIFNAPAFKARGGASWKKLGIAATAIVNFIGAETDTSLVPADEIGSWTTVDGSIAFSFPESSGMKSGTRIVLAVSNLFDRRPPYTVRPVTNESPHFDSTNASLLGRFISVNVTKSW